MRHSKWLESRKRHLNMYMSYFNLWTFFDFLANYSNVLFLKCMFIGLWQCQNKTKLFSVILNSAEVKQFQSRVNIKRQFCFYTFDLIIGCEILFMENIPDWQVFFSKNCPNALWMQQLQLQQLSRSVIVCQTQNKTLKRKILFFFFCQKLNFLPK